MVKFKSKATADLVMLGAHAKVVLSVWGKDLNGAGILQAGDIPAAVAALQRYAEQHDRADDDSELVAHDGPGHGNEDGADSQTNGGVSWRQRFTPVINMLNACVSSQTDVTWSNS